MAVKCNIFDKADVRSSAPGLDPSSYCSELYSKGEDTMNSVFNSQRCLAWMLILPMVLATAVAEYESRQDHKEYDFHYDIRYPGRLRSDVGRDKVTQKNAEDLKGYHRRVVKWWPKRGVDFTPLKDIPGAPLRTWTPRLPKENMTGTVLDNFPKGPFEAHLVNFRGIGDESLVDVKDPTSYRCPAPVLRFADGRKRVILAAALCEEDRQYLMKVYLKDRARVDKTLLQEEYEVANGARAYPEGVEHLYKRAGRVRFDTKHASIVVPAKAPLNGKSWVREDNHAQVMQTIAHLKNQMESYWAYHEYSGAMVRYWEQPKLYKYYPIFGHGGGGGGGGYSTCSLGGPNMEGVFHEWGHGMICGGLMYPGGGETAADALQIMADPKNIHKAWAQVIRPWKNLFHGQYPGGGGYEMMADDPNWGYAIAAMTSTHASQEDTTPMHVYAHMGVERGLWKKGEGIRGVGDMFGQIGARFAEFDCQQEFQFRQHFGSPNRSYLMAVDIEEGLYRCPPREAPEPFGVSISRLVPEPGAKKITVDFQGDFDPETYSDWRVCIVAVEKDGKCRYTPLWNKGEMSMDIKDGDKRFWLTVTATPKALMGMKSRDRKLPWSIYEAGFTFSYPYAVVLKGCKPGSPYSTLVDNYNMALATPGDGAAALYRPREYPRNNIWAFDLPPRMNKAEQAALAKQLRENVMFANAAKVKAEEELAAIENPHRGETWYHGRRIKRAAVNAYRAKLLLDDLGGTVHPNGGGWVSAKSHADPTAYVGPHCYVLGGAKVLDNAQLIDGAIVMGDRVVVKDHVKLSGKGALIGIVEASGFARIYWPEINHPKPETAAADIKELKITGMPDRERAPGFVANYGCLCPESVLLEDLLKLRREDGAMYGAHTALNQVNYNGRLVGAPGFDAADGAGAYVFNGKDQYAELSPEVADLGEIVVAMRVKPESLGKEQVLFDFGGALDNRFTLVIGKDGTPVLTWIVDGKMAMVGASAKLKVGQWAELRVESDGKSAVVYVDNKEAARAKTSFRPAYAFPPHLGRRNFVMRSRDDSRPNYMKGQLDYVRIYSQVPKKGETLPPVPLVSPTKVEPSIFAKLDAAYGDRPYRASVYEELARRSGDMDRARTWNDRLLLRKYRYELGSDPKTIKETTALRDKYYDLEARLAVERFRLYKEYLASPDIVKLQKERRDLDKKISEIHNGELRTASDALRKKHDEAKKNAQDDTADKSQTPEQKAYRAKLAKFDEVMAKFNKKGTEQGQKVRDIEKATTEAVEKEMAQVKEASAELKKKVEEREKELSESDGPVAKVFAPAVAEVRAKVDGLTKKEERTPAEEEELRAAKNDLRELIGHDGRRGRRYDTLMLHKDRGRHPPTGLFYRDLELSAMRMKLQHLERSVKAEVADRLMANEEFMAAKTAQYRARENRPERPEPPEGEEAASDYHEAYRELPEFKKKQALERRRNDARRSVENGFEPYANERLGTLVQKVEKAMNALRTRNDENAEASNRDEFHVVDATGYKRRHFSIHDVVSRAAADRLAGEKASDDMGQLKAAAETQGKWQLSIDDWNTYHKQEEDFENKNHRIKRWMKRIKPYRYLGR